MKNHTRAVLSLAALVATAVSPLAAQQGRAPDFEWSKSLASGSEVRVHNLSGDISVMPSTSGKVEVLGFKTLRGDDRGNVHAVVHEISGGIIVCVVWDDMNVLCDEDGYSVHGRGNDHNGNRKSMDLELRLPATMHVRAGSVSGDVSITGALADMKASSVSGDVTVDGATGELDINSVSGDVMVRRSSLSALSASSVSGDVDVRSQTLSGSGDIHVSTVSGDVTLELPQSLNADLRVSTVSGSLDSEYQMTLSGRMNRRSINAQIGKGGRDLKVSTVSGDVRLRMAK